ncbi:hypothetical protein [Methylobacterium sp. 190mf]|uniref:hypothetical protein n=1 Tax=Methylobacterium sp. 190mf TaxID=1761798 RepID=UPI0011B01B12|nr:hypothetical protein [Methylobacterium sp. 190mf]
MPQLSENTNLDEEGLIHRKASFSIISIGKRWIATMSRRRCISWNAALRDIRSDRNYVVRGVISARSLIQGLLRVRRTELVNLTGRYDRAAIMRLAVEAAKAHQIRIGANWSVSMSVGLIAAWQVAKAARRTALTRAEAPTEHDQVKSRCGSHHPEEMGGEENAGAAENDLLVSYLTRSTRILTDEAHQGAASSLMPALD